MSPNQPSTDWCLCGLPCSSLWSNTQALDALLQKAMKAGTPPSQCLVQPATIFLSIKLLPRHLHELFCNLGFEQRFQSFLVYLLIWQGSCRVYTDEKLFFAQLRLDLWIPQSFLGKTGILRATGDKKCRFVHSTILKN